MLQQLCKRFANDVGLAFAMLAALVALVPASVFGQALPQGSQSRMPEFEVGSVRPSGPGQRELNGFYTYPGGRIVGHGCMLEYLIMIAYHVQRFQISGGPGWTDLRGGERFDLEAKPSDSSSSAHWETSSPKIYPGEEERQMLQSLLANRFQLRVHRDVKQGPVYILRLGEGREKLKLTPPKDKTGYSWAGGIGGGYPDGDGLRGINISMPEFAGRLSDWLERPVIGETALQGSFDFEFHSGQEDPNSNFEITTSILASVKGLGLNLKAAKGPVETIVIDHVERPSEN